MKKNIFKNNFTRSALAAAVFLFSVFTNTALAQTLTPSVITYPVSSTQENGATLNGYAEISPDSAIKNITTWFQWGPDTGMSFATSNQGIYIQGAFSKYVGGLKKNTTYYYRAVAQVGDQIVFGSQQSFTTRSGITTTTNSPALVSTYSASNISSTFATLNGNIDPRDSDNTERWFEWGETTAFGKTTPHQAQGSSASSFSYVITGLKSDTIYYYRAVAQGSGGLVQGNTFALRTLGPGSSTGTGTIGTGGSTVTPTVDTLTAYGITDTQAVLNGLATSNAAVSALVWFEWGTGGSLKEATGKLTLSAPTSYSYIQVLGGLSPNTTYSFRAAIQTVYGTSYGPTRTFTTTKGGTTISGGGTSSSGGQTSGSGSGSDNQGGEENGQSSNGEGGSESNASFAKQIAWWLLVVLLILLIVSVVYHLTESYRRQKEERKKAAEAEEIKKEAEAVRRAHAQPEQEEETIRFKLPGQE